MNRNDSPRLINKLYEILKEIFSTKNLLEKFISEFKESLVSDDEHYVHFIILKKNLTTFLKFF